jgi:hypothetical protein
VNHRSEKTENNQNTDSAKPYRCRLGRNLLGLITRRLLPNPCIKHQTPSHEYAYNGQCNKITVSSLLSESHKKRDQSSNYADETNCPFGCHAPDSRQEQFWTFAANSAAKHNQRIVTILNDIRPKMRILTKHALPLLSIAYLSEKGCFVCRLQLANPDSKRA